MVLVGMQYWQKKINNYIYILIIAIKKFKNTIFTTICRITDIPILQSRVFRRTTSL